MKPLLPIALAAALGLPFAVVARDEAPATLRPATDFAPIRDRDARSIALFREMGKVIQSPRCLNCHPAGDRPSQTDRMTPHQPEVVRGADGHGAAGLECATCHGPVNARFANGGGSMPGNPVWHLAPIEMAWQGKSLGEICRQLKDPARNGKKTLADLVKHNGEDHLVGWGWHPGQGLTPAPGTQAAFGALTQAWIDSGARCPA